MKKPDCDDQPVLHLFSNKEQQAAVPGEEPCQEIHQKKNTFHKVGDWDKWLREKGGD